MCLIISPTVLLHCLPIVNLALYQLLDNGDSRRPGPGTRSLALLVFASVVIRAELAALPASFAIQLLLHRRISLTCLIKTGVFSSLVSVGVSLFFALAYARVHTRSYNRISRFIFLGPLALAGAL